MPDTVLYAVMITAAYLLGAVPNGLLAARLRGIDIRAVGSGNIGATNVFRSVGKGLGVAVFALDALKGFVPAFVFPLLAARLPGSPSWPPLGLACGAAAVAGHTWPVWLGFKGGKGVATGAGMLLGVAPAAAGLGLAGWIITMALGRYVSLASIVAAGIVAGAGWWLYRDGGLYLPVALTLLAALIIVRHRSNIGRLLRGTENRFGRKKP